MRFSGLGKFENPRPNTPSSLGRQLNVNFIRKERLYTKLKYSRSPAYDMVSGGVAILLAGLLGFLVSEKLGMELVDSGDFYYVWMYGVFVAFSLRPLVFTTNSRRSLIYVFSLKRLKDFYRTVFLLITRK